jgi:hypothetical protein
MMTVSLNSGIPENQTPFGHIIITSTLYPTSYGWKTKNSLFQQGTSQHRLKWFLLIQYMGLAISGDGTLSVIDIRSKKTEPFAQSEDQEDELLSIIPIKGYTPPVPFKTY